MASSKKTSGAFLTQKSTKKIREQECIDYDKEIKYLKTIGGHKEDSLAQMDYDDLIIPKNDRDPKRTLDSPIPRLLRVPK